MASAQVSFYPIKPDPALDGPTQMGIQSAGWLRLSGTAILGDVRNFSSIHGEQFGPASWGLDGILTWDGWSNSLSTNLVDVADDAISRIVSQLNGVTSTSVGVFNDGTQLHLDSSGFFDGGEFEVISPDGSTIFGVGWLKSTPGVTAYRYRSGVAPLLVEDPLIGPSGHSRWFEVVASDFDGTTAIGKMPGDELGRWTEATGMQILMPIATELSAMSGQMDISHDGSVIVARNPDNFPVIWREGLGIQVLDDCPLSSEPKFRVQCSEDGQRIDAWYSNRRVTWDATNGWRSLQEVLEGLADR